MRKKSSYRPRPVIADTMGYVKEGMKKLTQKPDVLLQVSIKNHDAMDLVDEERRQKKMKTISRKGKKS